MRKAGRPGRKRKHAQVSQRAPGAGAGGKAVGRPPQGPSCPTAALAGLRLPACRGRRPLAPGPSSGALLGAASLEALPVHSLPVWGAAPHHHEAAQPPGCRGRWGAGSGAPGSPGDGAQRSGCDNREDGSTRGRAPHQLPQLLLRRRCHPQHGTLGAAGRGAAERRSARRWPSRGTVVAGVARGFGAPRDSGDWPRWWLGPPKPWCAVVPVGEPPWWLPSHGLASAGSTRNLAFRGGAEVPPDAEAPQGRCTLSPQAQAASPGPAGGDRGAELPGRERRDRGRVAFAAGRGQNLLAKVLGCRKG